MSVHTILGANGNIAKIVSAELAQSGISVRQFSRTPKKVNPSDELVSGDLLDATAVSQAVKGSEVVFLLAGIQYNSAIWERDWPVVMRNTLDACIAHGAKLVFFDNMYACDPDHISHLTEDTPLNPKSRKGKVRKQILDMLWAEVKSGKISAIVARAPDFYGPDASNSVLDELVIKKLKAGKNAQWLYSGDKKHSFIYIPDAGKATAFLALQKDAWNQTWNLPTDNSYPSVKEIAELINQQQGTKLKLQVMPAWLVSTLGLFMPVMKEIAELRYQSDSDYCFDSSKIEQAYGLKPTKIKEGLSVSLKS
ncbi:NAD-dependent epimerase/dehydratase family protein [Algoriphagus sp. D3-2-R+10]|uniref:NAD-dependent epimerase/dehydratase family protein n=1 Tax=Algoriphagus aurantiacus TaxID=3103948 RepID=UPI002B380B62|nr:NAD-dependent epimerase/dehydratase family protein [Algoriphagus sp. D3-2-R+10]MEB2777686.1 NAD-dependent epimerase/dehydratase family protein [Algoriphagus sp. D3-2-R+10]